MIADYIKNKLSKVMDDVVVDEIKSKALQLNFVNNKIAKTGTEESNIISIFIAKDKKLTSTSLKDINKKSADILIKKLIKFIKKAKPNNNYNGIAKGPFKYSKITGYDKKLMNINTVDYTQSAINEALENSKRASGVLQIAESSRRLLTSNNIEAEDKGTAAYFSIRALMNKEASGHEISCSRNLKEFNPEKAGKKAGEIAKKALNPKEGPRGKFDVVFGQMAFANLIEQVADVSSIFYVESGLSFLANKMNKKLGNFDLIDDGTLENGLATSRFDSEGVPTQRNLIIKNGILKTYLHNTSSAKRHKVKTTANAGLITPSPWNIVFDTKKGNVFDIKNGLYITNVWYTRFNSYHTGDFSTIPRDGIFLIKNGEITDSIKHIRITENILNLIKNIALADKEVKQIKSWETETAVFTPKVLVKNVNITKPVI
jgi:PmbA protein